MTRALFAAWMAWLALGLLACYSTPTPACAFVCGDDNSCPDGYSCAGDGWCKRNGAPENTMCGPQRPPDGAPPADAPMNDALTSDAAEAGDAAAPDDAAPDDGAAGDAAISSDGGSEDAVPPADAPISTADAAAPVVDASSTADALLLAP